MYINLEKKIQHLGFYGAELTTPHPLLSWKMVSSCAFAYQRRWVITTFWIPLASHNFHLYLWKNGVSNPQ